eukprot:COSAG05_NODE_466_length_9533_cov_5.547806_9_plen_99_part_00
MAEVVVELAFLTQEQVDVLVSAAAAAAAGALDSISTCSLSRSLSVSLSLSLTLFLPVSWCNGSEVVARSFTLDATRDDDQTARGPVCELRLHGPSRRR